MASAATATGVLAFPRVAWAANTAYVMTYFTESPQMLGADYGLHLAVSRDGLNWTPLNQNNPVVTPHRRHAGPAGPVRAPQAGRHIRGDRHGSAGHQLRLTNQFLHVWDSTNLTSFTGYRRIQMHTISTTHTWAPTAFWDASRGQYGIVYSANNGRDVFLVNYTSDFRTVTAPQGYFSPNFGVLDGDIVVDGNTTYLYYSSAR